MRPSVILLAVFLLYFTPQPSIGQDYFPLQEGNVWYLSSIPDYIGSTIVINDLEYVEFCTPRGCDYYRKDSSGNIYVKSGDAEEMLLYKLGGDVGDEWVSGGSLHFAATLESKTETVVTAYETYYNCVRISFRGINVIDADHAIWFAPDVGTVKIKSLDWGIVFHLIKAYVNGNHVPSVPPLPAVAESIPEDGQSDIPIDASITLKFNLGINPSFINSDYFQIYSVKNGIISGQFEDDYKYSYYNVIFTPDVPLEYEDTLLVTVNPYIRDYANDPMYNEFNLTFYTEAFANAPVLFLQDTISNFTKLNWGGDFDLGDYDNDGDEDIIIFGTVDSTDVGLFHHIELYEQDDGIFYKVPTDFLLLNPELGGKGNIKWIDYNNDDLLDIIYAGKDTLHQSVTLFYENMGGTFEIDPSMQLGFSKASIDWSDYNHDGYLDLAIWGSSSSAPYAAVYKNNHGSYFTNQEITDPPLGVTGIIKWVDYDSDGDSDLITVGQQLFEISLYENVSGEFQKTNMRVESDDWLPYRFNIDFTDLENDGDIDFLIGQYIIRQDNGSLVVDSNPLELHSTFARFNDFDNDGDEDLFVIGNKEDPVKRAITYIQILNNNNGNLIISKEVNLKRLLDFPSVIWKDINGDGKIDLIMNTTQGFMIYYNLMSPLDIARVDNLPYNIFLYQNYPNPFNPSTTLQFDLQVATKVTLIIYDILGREVVRLVDRHIGLGDHQIEWNSRDAYNQSVPSGIYIAHLTTPEYSKSIKMLLLK